MSDSAGDELLTSSEVAAILGLSKKMLPRLKKMGVIVPVGQLPGKGRQEIYQRAAIVQLKSTARDGDGGEGASLRSCACGCNTPLIPWSRGRFIKGHHVRLSEYGAVYGVAVKRRFPRPTTDVGVFLRDKWSESGKNAAEFAASCGLYAQDMVAIIKGRRPQDGVLARLRASFSDFPEGIHSYTEELRAREANNRAKIMSLKLYGTPAARAKISAARTRLSSHEKAILATAPADDPERIAIVEKRQRARDKYLKTVSSSTAEQARRAALAARNQSPEWRAQNALRRKLRTTPVPSEADRRQWAEETASALSVSVLAIREYWRPVLRSRGLMNPGGRPRKQEETRCAAYQQLKQERDWNGLGRAPHRFDVQLGELLDTTYQVARDWRLRHAVTGCPRCRQGGSSELEKS